MERALVCGVEKMSGERKMRKQQRQRRVHESSLIQIN